MECTVVVGTKEGKTYNVEAKDEQARIFLGKKIGDIINITPLGLKGYEAEITGGSDKSGFPMRKDVHLTGRAKALLSSRGSGYRPSGSGIRKRKTVVGNVVTEEIVQINTKVVKEGKDSIEKLIGKTAVSGEEGEPEEKPVEKKEEKEAPAKEEEKPVEKEKKQEEAKPEVVVEQSKEPVEEKPEETEEPVEEKPEETEEPAKKESVSEEPKEEKKE